MSEQVLYDNCMANTTVRRRTFFFFIVSEVCIYKQKINMHLQHLKWSLLPWFLRESLFNMTESAKGSGAFFFLLRLTFLFDNQGRNKIQQQSSEHIIRCRTLPELWSHVFTPQASSEIFQASLSSLPVPLEYIYWWVREFQLYGKIKTKQLSFFPVLRINHECTAIDTRVEAVLAQTVSYHNSNT